MKYLGLILAVTMALVAGQVLARRINEMDSELVQLETRAFDQKIRLFLEKMRIIVRDGNSSMGVPPLDPFVSESSKLNLNEELVSGTVEASNFTVTGLSGYTIDKATMTLVPQKVTIGLTWPVIHSEGSYKMDIAVLKDFKVYGSGTYKVTLKNLSFVSTVWLKVSGGVAVKKMETSISLESIQFAATGIFDDNEMSEIMSELVSDVTPDLLREYQTEITTMINGIATKKMNEYFEGKSLTEIIAIMG